MKNWHPSRHIIIIAIIVSSLFIWLLADIGTTSAQVADPYITKDNGQTISYTIVVTNPSSSTITGLGIVDYPPSSLSGSSYISFASGGATGNGTSNDIAMDTVVTDPFVTNENGQTEYYYGQAITYTIVVTNPGPQSISGLVVLNNPPSTLTNTSYTSSATGGAVGYTPSGSGAISDTLTMPANSTATYLLRAIAPVTGTAPLSNTTRIIVPDTVPTNYPDNDTATDVDTFIPRADISITKDNGQTEFLAGQAVTYTIVVTNHGPDTVDGVLVTDIPPTELENVTYTSTSQGGASGSSLNGTDSISDILTMPSGSSVIYQLRATVIVTALTYRITNSASVSFPPVVGNDTTNDMASDMDCAVFTEQAGSRGKLIFLINLANDEECHPGSQTISLTNDITLSARHNNYVGRNGLPPIRSEIVIEGNNHIIQRDPTFTICVERGGNETQDFRLFMVDGETGEGYLTLNNVSLLNGCANNLFAYVGGAVYNGEGTLIIRNSRFSGNIAQVGGAIYSESGNLVIESSTLDGNKGRSGAGAIMFFGSGSAGVIVNSTFSRNRGQLGSGGAIVNRFGEIQIINSTFYNNTVYGAGDDGAIYNIDGIIELVNTIIVSSDYNTNCLNSGTLIAATNNRFDDKSCNGYVHANIKLDPNLADNGGPTPTHALLSGSSAIDAAEFVSCTNPAIVNGLDQRGYVRPFDGDNNTSAICDIGAFEFGALPAPPANTNLIYNPSFNLGANGKAGWRTGGSLLSDVVNGWLKLRFPTNISGWFHQFRTAYPLPADSRMVAWVTVANPAPVTQTFQFVMRDSDLSNTYLCSFTVPPNAPARNFYMRFITATDWEIIRADMRPTVVGSSNLLFDNVNLRYRPWLTFTQKECIPPIFVSDNLVQNGDFSDAGNHWSFSGSLQHLVIPSGSMRLYFNDVVDGWMQQMLGSEVPQAGTVYEAQFDLLNVFSVAKTMHIRLVSPNGAELAACNFLLPANSGWQRYTMRFRTSTNWNGMLLAVRPLNADSVSLYIDNIDVRHNSLLNVSTTECSSASSNEVPTIPPENELVQGNRS